MFTKTQIEKYFFAEKKAGLLLVIIGVVGVATSIFFFSFLSSSFYTGVAVPFSVFGLILFMVGFTAYKRSDAYRIRTVYAYDMNPAELKEKELPRMKKRMKNFALCIYGEIFLLLVGVALYINYMRDFSNDFWRGLGIGIVLISILALVTDYFTKKMAQVYCKALTDFASKR